MIHEYALDPEAISEWPSFRYFYDHFGIHTGRLISAFPSKWKRAVYRAVASGNSTPIQKQSIVERLANIDDKLYWAQRSYDGAVSWIENALLEHSKSPFQAIITNQQVQNASKCVVADHLDVADPLWSVPTQRILEREPDILAAAASRLLRLSTEIIFVDPHFKPERQKWLRPLEAFVIHAVASRPSVTRLEYHFKFDPDRSGPFDADFIHECNRRLAPIIPAGMSIRLIRWKKRPEGKSFHARLLLTDKGGIGFDYGLDEGDEKGDTTLVSLLDPGVFRELWNDFQKHPDLSMCSYEFDNETTIGGTKP